MKTKKKKFSVVLAAVLGIAASYHAFEQSQTDIYSNDTLSQKILIKTNIYEGLPLERPETKEKANPVILENITHASELTNHSLPNHNTNDEDFMEWRRSRGEFTPEELSLYQGYHESDLMTLANGGDLLAIEILRDASEDQREIFAERQLMAAAAGSTFALTQWNVFFHNDVIEADQAGYPDRVRQLYLDRLADFEIALRRGDVRAWEKGQQHLKEYFETYGGKTLTENEISDVSAIADERLRSIEAYRTQNYWPELINSTDPSALSPEYRAQIQSELVALTSTDHEGKNSTWGQNYLNTLFE